MSIAFIFPGQGSQVVGMGKALYDAFPIARETLQNVDDILGQSLSRLMFEGPVELLTETQNAQPALFAASIMLLRTLEKEGGFYIPENVAVTAGHSLGEYSALVAAGTLNFAETVELLRLRGQAMQQAVLPGEGAMAALLNLSPEQLDNLPQPSDQTCVIANDNAIGQVVISGHRKAVEEAAQWAKNVGGRSILLNVSGPFHSSLMAPAEEVMAEVLEKVTFLTPTIPVISNVSAEPQTDPLVLKKHLSQQLTGRVRWRETMETMTRLGISHLVEVGSGTVLSGLARRSLPEMTTTSLSTPQDLSTFLNHLNERKTHV